MTVDADRIRREVSIVPFLAEPKPMVKVREGQWKVRCSFHADRTPSMLVGIGARGWGYFCYGCGARGDVIRYVMETRSLRFLDAVRFMTDGNVPEPVYRAVRPLKDYDRAPARKGVGQGRIVATYDYFDEEGTLLYQTVRYAPKDFRQRQPHPSGHGWLWTLQGARRVLYRLPELVAAATDRPVYVLEGEKDVDSWRATGRLATCNPCGAGKWRPEYSETLRGRAVVIIPDNDEAGRKHADQVLASLAGLAFVTVKRLPDAFKDVSEWLAAHPTQTRRKAA